MSEFTFTLSCQELDGTAGIDLYQCFQYSDYLGKEQEEILS